MVLSEQQNYYPDVSFIAPNGTKIALDLKSTYRKTEKTVSGFTLGVLPAIDLEAGIRKTSAR